MIKIIIKLICLLSILSCKDINKFSAGSYPYAETYIIDKPEKEVINAISKLKEDNPDYKAPKFQWSGSEVLLNDKVQKNGYFIFYIFIKERNQIFQSYVKEESPGKSSIGFISVQNGLSLGNWKNINKDLSEGENTEIKKAFERIVIKKIK